VRRDAHEDPGHEVTRTLLLARVHYEVVAAHGEAAHASRHSAATMRLSGRGLQLLRKAYGHHLVVRLRATLQGGGTAHRQVVLQLKTAGGR
jgi:hypothetical protein